MNVLGQCGIAVPWSPFGVIYGSGIGRIMPGILLDDRVEVRDEAEGSRLYGRGNFGCPMSGGGTELDLIEAAYLVGSRRLEVFSEGNAVQFEELFMRASSEVPGFDIRYLVYSDLRGRGLVARSESGEFDISVFPRGKNMSDSRPEFLVRAVSERSGIDIAAAAREAGLAAEKKKKLLYGVADEEGDVTYYTISVKDPAGSVFPEPSPERPVGRLIGDRVYVFGQDGREVLRSFGFYGRPTLESVQLSLMEAMHLVGKGRLEVLGADDEKMDYESIEAAGENVQNELRIRRMLYADLRERGLVTKTGFKYGTHFRAYQGSPDDTHARYLVHAVPADAVLSWPDVSRAVRLSVGVKKEFLFGAVGRNSVRYLEFGWFRPR